MTDTLDDLNCIQICFNLSVIRVYYIEKQYYVSEVDMDKIKPQIFKTAKEIIKYLTKLLNSKNNIDVRYFFNAKTTSLKKKIKILEKNGYYNNIDMLYELLLLLI